MMKMTCSCEQKLHTAPIKALEVSEGASEKIVSVLNGYQNIYLVADQNTYAVCGKRVESLLKKAGILSHSYILPKSALATAENVGEVLIHAGVDEKVYNINHFSTKPDYILAVGSGSVNDICRMVSYRLGIEYGVCATAPSMDGYISVVAPLLVNHKKIIYTCSTARHIIIDLNICAQAPYELLVAGVGDMIGKYIALLDWELSHMLTKEYYCPEIAKMVFEATGQCVSAAQNLSARNPEDIRAIVSGLLLSGLGIAYTGSSRPASGTEHMIGQTWEVMDLENGRKTQLHGVDVGQATFVAMLFYQRLYQECDDSAVKALIAPYLPFFEAVFQLQKTLKLPFGVTDKKTFLEGIYRGRTFRERYTVLQYLYDKNLLTTYAEDAFSEIMKYHML